MWSQVRGNKEHSVSPLRVLCPGWGSHRGPWLPTSRDMPGDEESTSLMSAGEGPQGEGLQTTSGNQRVGKKDILWSSTKHFRFRKPQNVSASFKHLHSLILFSHCFFFCSQMIIGLQIKPSLFWLDRFQVSLFLSLWTSGDVPDKHPNVIVNSQLNKIANHRMQLRLSDGWTLPQLPEWEAGGGLHHQLSQF